jgi:hypothetical protein
MRNKNPLRNRILQCDFTRIKFTRDREALGLYSTFSTAYFLQLFYTFDVFSGEKFLHHRVQHIEKGVYSKIKRCKLQYVQ